MAARRAAVLALAAVLFCSLLGFSSAGVLTGSPFAFDNCPYSSPVQNRFDVDIVEYDYQPTKKSRFCLKVSLFAAEFCSVPKGIRCCKTGVTALKMFVDTPCKASTFDNVTVNGVLTRNVTVQQVAWTDGKKYPVATIAGAAMNLAHEKVDGALICMNIEGACNTLEKLTNPYNRPTQELEFSLYDDAGKSGYNCCPAFTVTTNRPGWDEEDPSVSPPPKPPKVMKPPPRPPAPPSPPKVKKTRAPEGHKKTKKPGKPRKKTVALRRSA